VAISIPSLIRGPTPASGAIATVEDAPQPHRHPHQAAGLVGRLCAVWAAEELTIFSPGAQS
jgi:hypothetical protein